MQPGDDHDVRNLRGHPRRSIFRPVAIQAGATPLRANLLDLSASGALVHSTDAPPAGTALRLTLGGAMRAARVVWQDGVRFGIAFARPLRDAELASLLKH
ncbi:PilZ domain-containing protein [Sphingomonas sp. AR_OL41]|jgi:hypothetical protein|uniref:PilZ domain-containing protein n=1 Tax=Sphingomonas sp. AR_OL41 TaxID=3042729 RepID=UPI0024804274|nr:PilZ domain-containing protein [Sphingomonas sp. AR_OL41]MDH7974975.1 PilZ domain-containing protein [Sphingomonas sp. AR_OL41]